MRKFEHNGRMDFSTRFSSPKQAVSTVGHRRRDLSMSMVSQCCQCIFPRHKLAQAEERIVELSIFREEELGLQDRRR